MTYLEIILKVSVDQIHIYIRFFKMHVLRCDDVFVALFSEALEGMMHDMGLAG